MVFTDLFRSPVKLESLAHNHVAVGARVLWRFFEMATLFLLLSVAQLLAFTLTGTAIDCQRCYINRHWLAVIQPHFQIISTFLFNPKSWNYAVKNKQSYHSPQYTVLPTFSGMYLEFFHLPYFVSRFVSIYFLTAKSKLFSLLTFIVASCLFNPQYAGVLGCCKPSSLTAARRPDSFSNIELQFRKPLRDWLQTQPIISCVVLCT